MDEKINVNFAPGQEQATVTIYEGKAPTPIEPQPPVKIEIEGTIEAPLEYLSKRVNAGQFKQEDCHILVDRENITITLVTNESDPYKRGRIQGALTFHPMFEKFGINAQKVWSPAELGMFVKMNRAFFPDKAINMKLVSTLMNFTATVNHQIERSIQENGNRTDNFTQVVNSNLPASFALEMPIFKGTPADTIDVETFAQVNGREVGFILISPGAQSTLEAIRDNMIDDTLNQIREIAPNIAIIEV